MGDNGDVAIVAGGCFWITQALLSQRDGVISTRVGFTGGENDNPTDENNSGHAEAVEIVFDPDQVSYRGILEYFLQIHRADLDERVVGSEYRSEIFFTTDEQRLVAEDVIADVGVNGYWPGKIVTKISAAGPFWEAPTEDQNFFASHQHYAFS